MKIGLILGGGDLPQKLIQATHPHLAGVIVLGNSTLSIPKSIPTLHCPLGHVETMLTFLRAHHVDTLTLGGPVQRPTFSEISFDKTARQWMKRLAWNMIRGDDALLSGVLTLLENEGFTIISASDWLPDILTPLGHLTRISPTSEQMRDIQRGLRLLDILSPEDVGQSVIVHEGNILGIEAAEGTAKLIKRCSGTPGVLVKASKIGQNIKVDLPTVGLDTLIALKDGGLSGLALEAHHSQILNQEKVLQFANDHELFVIGISRNTDL